MPHPPEQSSSILVKLACKMSLIQLSMSCLLKLSVVTLVLYTLTAAISSDWNTYVTEMKFMLKLKENNLGTAQQKFILSFDSNSTTLKYQINVPVH